MYNVHTLLSSNSVSVNSLALASLQEELVHTTSPVALSWPVVEGARRDPGTHREGVGARVRVTDQL